MDDKSIEKLQELLYDLEDVSEHLYEARQQSYADVLAEQREKRRAVIDFVKMHWKEETR